MKAKTIKAVITKKINEWMDTIEDEELRKLASKNIIVTGGSIASMLLGEQVNDFDIYFRNRETALAIAKYYVGRFRIKNAAGIEIPIMVDESSPDRVKIHIKSAGIASEDGAKKPYEYFEGDETETRATAYVSEVMQDPGDIEDAYEETEKAALETDDKGKYRPVFMSTNAITLSNRIQLILRFYGEPDQIHENYDYQHCMNYWDSKTGDLELKKEALECLLAKELRYCGSKYPICSLIRMRKFIKRGWSINAGQVLKMVMQISELDLTDIEVLRDQLTGVDVAYFIELIDKVAEKDPTKVNTAYLIEIIDRMF